MSSFLAESEFCPTFAEQRLVYQSDTYKKQTADRLLKLLMISKTNKIPLSIIDCLKWDVGLPHNHEKTIVTEFPDYFRVIGGGNRDEDGVLELVCWSDELAVSVVEKKGSIAFPMQFLRGFEVDKKSKKWEDEWQKLPYISPYEDASHLLPNSDESDKWTVAVLHELLHILVPKKTERDNLLLLGEYLGLRPRFKRALLQHPGIFCMSTKIGTYTVVLKRPFRKSEIEREAGKRPLNSKEEFPSRTKMHDGNNALVSSRERSSVPKRRGKLLPGKMTSTS